LDHGFLFTDNLETNLKQNKLIKKKTYEQDFNSDRDEINSTTNYFDLEQTDPLSNAQKISLPFNSTESFDCKHNNPLMDKSSSVGHYNSDISSNIICHQNIYKIRLIESRDTHHFPAIPFIQKGPSSFLTPPENNYLNPYKAQNEKEYGPCVPDYTNTVKYFALIDDDNGLTLTYLMNIINDIYTTKRSTETPSKNVERAYEKLYLNLSENYGEKFGEELPTILSIVDYKGLYEAYILYKNWFNSKFKIEKLESKKNVIRHHAVYINNAKKNTNFQDNILKMYIEILFSENYNFLFKVFPFFILVHKINTNKEGITQTVYLIRYLQLIIGVVETFRFQYFSSPLHTGVLVEDLYQNPKFNETILKIGILFRRILIIINISNETMNVLDIYNFIYFIRTKYNELFILSKTFRCIAYGNPFICDFIHEKADESGILQGYELTEGTKGTFLYKSIKPYFDENQLQNLRLEFKAPLFRRKKIYK
ncbi:hypothetical protein H311_01960, partial [Anncaliia algerae PRA109]